MRLHVTLFLLVALSSSSFANEDEVTESDIQAMRTQTQAAAPNVSVEKMMELLKDASENPEKYSKSLSPEEKRMLEQLQQEMKQP